MDKNNYIVCFTDKDKAIKFARAVGFREGAVARMNEARSRTIIIYIGRYARSNARGWDTATNSQEAGAFVDRVYGVEPLIIGGG